MTRSEIAGKYHITPQYVSLIALGKRGKDVQPSTDRDDLLVDYYTTTMEKALQAHLEKFNTRAIHDQIVGLMATIFGKSADQIEETLEPYLGQLTITVGHDD